MLKQDREDFIAFASGDRGHLAQLVRGLNARGVGHFEDHPLSAKLVRQHLAGLVSVWDDNPVPGAREWVLQFVAEARIADAQVRPMVRAALADRDCPFLPTVLYTMGTAPALFEDCGDLLLALASHPDHQVRWRIAQGLFPPISGSRRSLPACQSRRATPRVPLHTQEAQRRVARRQGPSLRVARPGSRLRRCPRLQGAYLVAHGRLASSPQARHRDPEIGGSRPWFLSKVRNRSTPMARAIEVLTGDSYDTTQVYVRACGLGVPASQQGPHP